MLALLDWEDLLLLALSVIFTAWTGFELWAAKGFPIPPWFARWLEARTVHLCDCCQHMPVDEHSPFGCNLCGLSFCDQFCAFRHKQRIHRVERKPGPCRGGGEAA